MSRPFAAYPNFGPTFGEARQYTSRKVCLLRAWILIDFAASARPGLQAALNEGELDFLSRIRSRADQAMIVWVGNDLQQAPKSAPPSY